MSDEPSSKPVWRQKLAAYAAGVALVGFISFLLLSNYRSQMDLRADAIEQLGQKANESAMAVEYFLLERKNDLKTMTGNRSLSVYFENKALGMSMDYGLRSSLLAVSNDFSNLVQDRRIADERIYERLLFVDASDEVLVDTEGMDAHRVVPDLSQDNLFAAEDREPRVTADLSQSRFQLQVVMPYYFKEGYAGRIIAWITPGIVERHLLKEVATSKWFSGFIAESGGLSDSLKPHTLGDNPLVLADYAKTDMTGPLVFRGADHAGQSVEYLAVGVKLSAARLTLIHAVPAVDVLGHGAPWHLLVAMVLLSVLILAGIALALRSSTRNLVLRARLDEASRRRKQVESANVRLKSEMRARELAEQRLQLANDRLEDRVTQRTADLLKANSELEEEMKERKRLEAELLHAQKMESIGQLAAGIAHEINTPIQYVSDNIRFLSESIDGLLELLRNYRHLLEQHRGEQEDSRPTFDGDRLEEEADLPYLLREIPKAISQGLEGTDRVSKIVLAMKGFSHPGTEEKSLANLNEAIETTITVSRNEWKYVATIERDFDPTLPMVVCLVGEINQVLLNLIVNAAHAIADVVGDGEVQKGVIGISTRRDGTWVEVRVSDTGTGIPEEYRSRIFEPFFTTKEVGKGTGQGLAIAHSVITEKHGGTITCETESGKGTTFILRLPIDGTTPVNEEDEHDVHSPALQS